jgi:hypothetical protein
MRILHGLLILMVIGCGQTDTPPSGVRVVLELDLSGLPPAQAQDTVEQALAVIGRRAEHLPLALPSQSILEGVTSLFDLIGRFGEKPTLLQEGPRITVDLPTAENVPRAQRLLSKRGLLEFQLLVLNTERDRILARLHAVLGGANAANTASTAEQTKGLFEAPSQPAKETVIDRSLFSLLTPQGEDLVFPSDTLARIQTLRTDRRVQALVPADLEFLFSNTPEAPPHRPVRHPLPGT